MQTGRPGRHPIDAARACVGAIRGDYAALCAGREKYFGERLGPADLPRELVRKVGLQMMVLVRLMRFARDAVGPRAARRVGRLLRLLYRADVDPDAELAPGTGIVHGTGLVVEAGVHTGSGTVLLHDVTLARAVDPETGASGAPHLGEDVHVGPGAILLGPIVVGDGAKIMAGAVLTRSVGPRSLVRPPPPVARARAPHATAR